MRHDIQFLRGVAVLLVVISHAFPAALPHGGLGVDLFFVISGFLMTGMIVGGLERGDFTFAGFYFRRARRLLPASFTTIAGTVLLAVFLLPASAWPSFGWQVVGALTFTANFVAEAQVGGIHYLQPLSHFWSLALEEQFYFLFPLLLWIAPKKLRMPGVALIAVESLIIMLAFGSGYGLLYRAWELLAGSLAYFAKDYPVSPRAKWAMLLLVPVSVAFDLTVLIVAATAIMLIGKDDWVRLPPLETLGDWSYSIYLIHWPLMAFGTVYCGGVLPPVVATALALLSISLAALQYRYVEQPFRRPQLVYAYGLSSKSLK